MTNPQGYVFRCRFDDWFWPIIILIRIWISWSLMGQYDRSTFSIWSSSEFNHLLMYWYRATINVVRCCCDYLMRNQYQTSLYCTTMEKLISHYLPMSNDCVLSLSFASFTFRLSITTAGGKEMLSGWKLHGERRRSYKSRYWLFILRCGWS